MIEVELPDGSIAEFPDGTGNDVIKRALQRRFAPRGHSAPEFDPGVPGYNAETGMVERKPRGGWSSFFSGAADTAGAGFGDEIASTLVAPFTEKTRDQVLSEMRMNQRQAQADNPGAYLGGQVAGGLAQAATLGPASVAGRTAQAGGTFGRVALGSAADGAIMGGAYGAGSGEDATDRAAQAGVGLFAGGATGGLAPYAVSGASNLFRRAISPFAIPAERQAAISLLEREGVPLTAGQRTGSRALQFSESEIGGNRAANITEEQGRAFTRAAMRRAGQDTIADPDNMAALDARLSQGFEDISARNVLQADPGLLGDMVGTLQEYGRVLPSEQSRILGNIATDIGDRFQAGNGTMSGRDYQTIRSRLTKRAKNVRGSDNDLADAYTGLRNALDNAMDRSIIPEDAGEWRELRRQWGNKRVLENAVAGAANEAGGMGMISPARLRMAASAGNRGGYARGQGDFSELAHAGQVAMTPLPNSGTAARLSARSLGMMAPTILGAGYGGATGGDMQSALAGAGAGYLLQKGAGAALMARPVQNALANQLLAGGGDDQLRAAIARLIMAGGAPQAQQMLEGAVR